MIFGMKDAPSFTAAKANRDKRDKEEGRKVNAYAEIWSHPRMRKSFIIWSISMILYFYGYPTMFRVRSACSPAAGLPLRATSQ